MSSFPVPACAKLHLFGNPIVSGQDFGVAFAGDSKTTDTSTASNIRDGVRRAWRVPVYSAIGTRAISGPPARATSNFNRSSETTPGSGEQLFSGVVRRGPWVTATAYAVNDVTVVSGVLYRCFGAHTSDATTQPGVGASWTTVWAAIGGFMGTGPLPYGINGANTQRSSMLLNGRANVCPNICANWRFSANQTAGVTLHSSDINQPTQFASGDPFSGQPVRSRVIVWRDNAADLPMMDGFRLNPRRNGTNLGVGSLQTCVGTPGWFFLDADCGTGSGPPGIAIDFDSSVTDIGKVMVLGGVNFYRHVANVRVPGFFTCDVAVGGATAVDLAAALGGTSLSTRTDPIYAAQYLQAHHSPTGWYVDIFQNLTIAAGAALNAGDYSVLKREVADIIAAINTVHTLMNQPGLPVILLANSYCSGYSQAAMLLRARLVYELAQEHENVCYIDLNQYMPVEAAATGWWTTDDIHPSDDGSGYWAGVIWSAMVTSATVPPSLGVTYIDVVRSRVNFPLTRAITVSVTGTSPVRVFFPDGSDVQVSPGRPRRITLGTSFTYLDMQAVGSSSFVSLSAERSDFHAA